MPINQETKGLGKENDGFFGYSSGGLASKDSIPLIEVDSAKDQREKDGRVAGVDPVVRNGEGTSEMRAPTGPRAQQGLVNLVVA